MKYILTMRFCLLFIFGLFQTPLHSALEVKNCHFYFRESATANRKPHFDPTCKKINAGYSDKDLIIRGEISRPSMHSPEFFLNDKNKLLTKLEFKLKIPTRASRHDAK